MDKEETNYNAQEEQFYQTQDFKLRELAFASHPCDGKYPDDGELQCNRFYGKGDPIDFKRDSWEKIIKLSAIHNKLCKDEAIEQARKVGNKKGWHDCYVGIREDL